MISLLVCQGLVIVLAILDLVLILIIFKKSNKKIDDLQGENEFLFNSIVKSKDQVVAYKDAADEQASLLGRLAEKISDQFHRNGEIR